MRARWLLVTAAVGGCAAVNLFVPARPLLIWNASPSVPIGLYSLGPAGGLQVGELAAITPPPELAAYMARRRYLAVGVPLLKHVAALPGQRVCRMAAIILIDGRVAGGVLERDRAGRALPRWSDCLVVRPHQVFLLNGAPDSFDSRYFGAVDQRAVMGLAHPIWVRDDRR